MDLLSNSIEKGMSTDINSSSVMETGVKSLLKTAHQCIRARRATAERAELGRSRERGGVMAKRMRCQRQNEVEFFDWGIPRPNC